jgi:DNA-binding NarL/FixJ family response regulator
LTNHEIAAELDFSESTIRQDTMSIYRKMGVNGRAEAIKSVKKEEQDKDV